MERLRTISNKPAVTTEGNKVVVDLGTSTSDKTIQVISEQMKELFETLHLKLEQQSGQINDVDKKIEGEYVTPQDIDSIKYATQIKAEKLLKSSGRQLSLDDLLSKSQNVYEQAEISKQHTQKYNYDLGRFKSRILVETKKSIGMKGNAPNNHIKRKDVDLAIQVINDIRRHELEI